MEFPDDFTEGVTRDQIKVFADMLLAAHELAEALDVRMADRVTGSFAISEQRLFEGAELPPEIACFGFDAEHLRTVNFHGMIAPNPLFDGSELEDKSVSNATMSIELMKDSYDGVPRHYVYHIQYEPAENKHYISDNNSEESVRVDSVALSNFVASLVGPTRKQEKDYADFSNAENVRELIEIFEQHEDKFLVSGTVERRFQIGSTYAVITFSQSGKILSCEVLDNRTSWSSDPVNYIVEFKQSKTEMTLFQITDNGSKEIIVDEGDVLRFVETVHRILAEIRPEIELLPPEDFDGLEEYGFNPSDPSA